MRFERRSSELTGRRANKTNTGEAFRKRLSGAACKPPPVKEVGIRKKDGGTRNLGIPTIFDRIAQEVVKAQLEPILEPCFQDSSYGYRKGRNCHQVVAKATQNALQNNWAIDLDIKGFFDNIDHDLLLQAVVIEHEEPDEPERSGAHDRRE